MKYNTFIGPNGRLCAKPSGNGNRTLRDFINRAAEATTLSAADIKAVCAELADYLATTLAQGCTLNLPEIGTFGISLSLEEDGSERQLTGRDVTLKRVTFRAASTLKNQISLNISGIERARTPKQEEQRRALPLQERREKALQLAAAGEFTPRDYRTATHTSQPQASRDLTALVTDGLLTVRHLGNLCFYAAAPQA